MQQLQNIPPSRSNSIDITAAITPLLTTPNCENILYLLNKLRSCCFHILEDLLRSSRIKRSKRERVAWQMSSYVELAWICVTV